MTAKYFTAFLLLLSALLFGQEQEKLTANQIVDSSIDFCGGAIQISKIKSSKINYLLIQPDRTTAIVDDQLLTGKKYVQCILSKTHTPQTTFYNGEKISRIDGNSITHVTDLQLKEEIQLKTYTHIQYGYKQLNYQFTRLPDQKFKNFDCFVVDAKANNGYSTRNFFDKTNFRLLMVSYPGGNKSVMIDYIIKDGVLFNSQILNTFPNSEEIQRLQLQTVVINPIINDLWFQCPYTDKVALPQHIKTGRFISTNGVDTRFNRTAIAMDYTDAKGNTVLKRFIAWDAVSPDSFGLIDENSLKDNDKTAKPQLLVRVISWNKNSYVCQWITDTHTDTQDYKTVE